MLPGVLRGDYAEAEARFDVAALARRAGAAFVAGEATSLDLAGRRVLLADGAAVAFEVLSLDIGGGSEPVAGTLPVRPIEGLLARVAALELCAPPADPVIVVGAGPAGVELALALAWRWRGTGRPLALLTRTSVLPGAPARARRRALAVLRDRGVTVETGRAAANIVAGRLATTDGASLFASAVFWATGAVGPPLPRASGLALDALGCVRVDATLRSVSHPFVLAAGDCATSDAEARPKGGVWAVRAGPALARALLRIIADAEPPAWRPQRTGLTILGLGDGRALAWRGRWSASGRAPWWWKDRLDRRWLRGLLV